MSVRNKYNIVSSAKSLTSQLFTRITVSFMEPTFWVLRQKSDETNLIKSHFQTNTRAPLEITRQLQICRLNNPNLAATTFRPERPNATEAVVAAKPSSFRNVGGQRLFVTHLSTPIINSLHFFIFHGRDPPLFVNFG